MLHSEDFLEVARLNGVVHSCRYGELAPLLVVLVVREKRGQVLVHILVVVDVAFHPRLGDGVLSLGSPLEAFTQLGLRVVHDQLDILQHLRQAMKYLLLSSPIAHPLDKEDRNTTYWESHRGNNLVSDQFMYGYSFIHTFEVRDELNLVRRSDAPRATEVANDRLVPILAGVFPVLTLRPVLGNDFHECELFGISTCQF